MAIAIRTITREHLPEWVTAAARGFSDHADEELVEASGRLVELDRAFAAFDDGLIVGTTTTRTLGLTIPGGHAQMGYVDEVAVLPTHRRQGILTRMMRAQLEQMHERGEPFAALSASESLIYERFGFGVATWAEQWTIERHHTALRGSPRPSGRFQFIDAATAIQQWPKFQHRVAKTRVGMVPYSPKYWRFELRDVEAQRRSASKFFHVTYVRGDDVAGMLSYRIRDEVVLVVCLLATDSKAEIQLWSYCFGIDLMTRTQAFAQALDSPLPWTLQDPRRLHRSVHDHMWLRLIDVRAALEARRYDIEGNITLSVSDDFCAWNDGVYTLEAGHEGAVCTPTDKPPDLHLTVADLAAVYLGGVSFSTLAEAGRLNASDKSVIGLADRMFRTERAPWFMEL